jgi:hypothetical protein
VAPRERIDTGIDKRFVRRGKRGRLKECDDVGHSPATELSEQRERTMKSGRGDKGDQPRKTAKGARAAIAARGVK